MTLLQYTISQLSSGYLLNIHYSKEYKEQKLFPVLQSLARRTGHSDMYEGITHDTEPLMMPPNVRKNTADIYLVRFGSLNCISHLCDLVRFCRAPSSIHKYDNTYSLLTIANQLQPSS